jgi:hypothetical protein
LRIILAQRWALVLWRSGNPSPHAGNN